MFLREMRNLALNEVKLVTDSEEQMGPSLMKVVNISLQGKQPLSFKEITVPLLLKMQLWTCSHWLFVTQFLTFCFC